MPYFTIEKMPVFLSSARYRMLEEEVGKGKDAVWRASSSIAGNKATQEKSALMFDLLYRKFRENPSVFRSDWIHFDLSGKEASANVWDLLYDYCHFRGYAFLSDVRDSVDRVIASYEGESYQYPMGRIFSLNHFVRPAKWWRRFTHGMRGRTISVVINSVEVVRLVGDLSQFEVHSERFTLLCGEHFHVQGLDQKKKELQEDGVAQTGGG